MMLGWPWIAPTVSSDGENGLNHAYKPAARTSSARVKFLHLSKSATCCRVSVLTGPPDWLVENSRLDSSGGGAKTQGPPRTRGRTPPPPHATSQPPSSSGRPHGPGGDRFCLAVLPPPAASGAR